MRPARRCACKVAKRASDCALTDAARPRYTAKRSGRIVALRSAVGVTDTFASVTIVSDCVGDAQVTSSLFFYNATQLVVDVVMNGSCAAPLTSLAVFGIVVGVVVALAIIILALLVWCRPAKNKALKLDEERRSTARDWRRNNVAGTTVTLGSNADNSTESVVMERPSSVSSRSDEVW